MILIYKTTKNIHDIDFDSEVTRMSRFCNKT